MTDTSTTPAPYEARFFFTLPGPDQATGQRQHVMSMPITDRHDLVAALKCIADLGWSHSYSESYHGKCAETGGASNFDYDFAQFRENACPGCGRQLVHEFQRSMSGNGFDEFTRCEHCATLIYRTSPMHRVICEDGLVRHADFDDKASAIEWANWGHVCAARHEYIEVTR